MEGSNEKFGLLFLSAILLGGCSTAYYKTQQDKSYTIDKKEAVFVLQPTESTIENKQFARLLTHTLQGNGFKISDRAKCGFVFNLDEPTYENVGSYTTYNTSTVTTNTSGYVGNTYVYGRSTSTISTPQTHTFTYKTTYKKIYLDFACLDTNKQIEHIWEGFASAELNEWNEHPDCTYRRG